MKQLEFLPLVMALFLFLFHFPCRDLQSPVDLERITLYSKRKEDKHCDSDLLSYKSQVAFHERGQGFNKS